MKMKFPLLICFIILNNAFSAEVVGEAQFNKYGSDSEVQEKLGRIGDYGYPDNPTYDRAIGFLLKGKVQNAVSNNGNFITWDHHPAGFWGQYGYLPHVGFIAGVPGHAYSSEWSEPGDDSWTSEYVTINEVTLLIWKSNDAYNAWVEDVDDPLTEEGNFKTVVYNIRDDRGDIAEQKESISMLNTDSDAQWVIDHESELIYLYFENPSKNPNSAGSFIGLAYPWAIRPAFKTRSEGSGGFYFDQYNYGADLEEWTDDDEYVYYGATFAESWFMEDAAWGTPSIKTDWQATNKARYNSHNLDNTAGQLFGETDFTDPSDPKPLLAHSAYPGTWPSKYSFDTGEFEQFWPGWWADEYYGDSPASWSSVGIYDCNGTRADEGCWKPLKNRFVSDMDVYMEFDDRWAHVGNSLDSHGEYFSTGYPMGLKVMSTAHSYGVAYAEDIMFVTVKVRNESGDFCAFEKDKNEVAIQVRDEDGAVICDDAMVMPDGTKLNRGAGFDYKKLYLGFYMDADVLATDINGTPSGPEHTPSDDFMKFIDCRVSPDLYPNGCEVVNGDTLIISMSVIGDYDGSSNAAKGYSMNADKVLGPDFGMVAVQLLDSPYSTGYVDMDQDGFIDIYPGEPLKMTDWHWFAWEDRPGVLAGEQSSDNPAMNKELIQYQVMAGDNTNLTASEKNRYFHNDDPDTDDETNPHLDSIEGLKLTDDFIEDVDGLDCVLELSTGPFDLLVGEEVSFSFTIIFGANTEDLLQNAKFAQIMYNSHYQGYTPPITPNLMAITGHNKVELYWDNISINSKDVITGYSDFEGFKIYRSLDGGATWGSAEDEIFISDVSQGWQPLSIGCEDNPKDEDHTSDCELFSSKISCRFSDYSSFIKRDSDNDNIDDCIWKYAQFDLSSEADAAFCIYGRKNDDSCVDNLVRDADVQGVDPMAQWLNLGYNTGLEPVQIDPENTDSVYVCGEHALTKEDFCCGVNAIDNGILITNAPDCYSDENLMLVGDITEYQYKFVDYSVNDGVEYVYSVVAYDRGVPPEVISYIPVEGDTTYTQTVVSVPDPGGWGKINPFQILESPKGSSVLDPNFVKVEPGYTPGVDLSMIKVVPNPYIVHSDFNETQYKKKIRFTRLPEICTITIFTVTGEKVRELHHDHSTEGNAWWDLRSYNNQEIAPGLYIYVVETPTGEKKIDKFAVVR